MCLLINHPAATAFDFADIEDFYNHNSDGLGVMYASDGILHVRKSLPATATAAWEFYQEHCLGRDCVIHFRLRTHGNTDLTNCHPYEVFGEGSDMPIYMAHNGVLSHGNAADTSKSDTWHYLRNYIIPIARHAPEIVFEPAFVELLEEHIGSSNKFIFMNHEGRVSIVNKDAFVDYKGADLSNTYAWSAHKGGHGGHGYYGGGYGRFTDYESLWGNVRSKGGYSTTSRGYSTKQVGGSNPWDKYEDVEEKWAEQQSSDPIALHGANSGDEWAYEFFAVLHDHGMRAPHDQLTFEEVTQYYGIVGDQDAYDLIDLIEDAALSASQVQQEITHTLLTAALDDTLKYGGE